jgi:hypothetical protein
MRVSFRSAVKGPPSCGGGCLSRRCRAARRGAGRSDAVSAALAIFARCSPADPVKVHNVLLAALRAKAFHLALVVVDAVFSLLCGVLPGRFGGSVFRCAALGGWHVEKLPTCERSSVRRTACTVAAPGALSGVTGSIDCAHQVPVSFSMVSIWVLHRMQWRVTGRALRRSMEMSSPQDSQVP